MFNFLIHYLDPSLVATPEEDDHGPPPGPRNSAPEPMPSEPVVARPPPSALSAPGHRHHPYAMPASRDSPRAPASGPSSLRGTLRALVERRLITLGGEQSAAPSHTWTNAMTLRQIALHLERGVPPPPEHALAVLTALCLSSDWPAALQIHYQDEFIRPPVNAVTPRLPHTVRRPPVVTIEREASGGFLVGRGATPRDLRMHIEPCSLALFDALLTGLRLFCHEEAEVALHAVLRITDSPLPVIERTTTRHGIPTRRYRTVLLHLRSCAIGALHISATRLSRPPQPEAGLTDRGDGWQEPDSTGRL